MNIAVCIKQVPDTASQLKISEDNKTIEDNGIKYEINPFDEYALEEALRLKDKDNTVNITVISLGPERVKKSLTKTLAMGADEAIHLQTDNSINDCMTIANIITNEIKKKQYDLILFGKKSVDQDNNQVGMIIGEINGIPCISNCSEFVIEDNKIVANREVEGSVEVFEGEFPVIITHEKGKNELRYPSLKDLMAAKKKSINTIDVDVNDNNNSEVIRLEYPKKREEGIIIGEDKSAVPELIRILREERKLI